MLSIRASPTLRSGSYGGSCPTSTRTVPAAQVPSTRSPLRLSAPRCVATDNRTRAPVIVALLDGAGSASLIGARPRSVPHALRTKASASVAETRSMPKLRPNAALITPGPTRPSLPRLRSRTTTPPRLLRLSPHRTPHSRLLQPQRSARSHPVSVFPRVHGRAVGTPPHRPFNHPGTSTSSRLWNRSRVTGV